MKEMVNGYESIARRIQNFMWEGRPYKSEKINRTNDELEAFLENIRTECWSNYDSGVSQLGWKD